MIVEGIKTDKILVGKISLTDFLNRFIKSVNEEDIFVFSSKVIGILEGRAVPVDTIDKIELIKQESDFYLPKKISKYGNMFTINKNTLISAGGIDESNADGHFILWPNDPMQSAKGIREYLIRNYQIKKLGVIICDSTVMPLRRGTIGIMIGWSGFKAIKNLIGTKDLFGRDFKISTIAVGSNLAAAGNTVMGEGIEQTPIAVIKNAPNVEYTSTGTVTKEEYQDAFINIKDDLFAPFLTKQKWKKRKQN